MKESKESGGADTDSSKGESHRIYWQQWPSSKSATTLSRRDLITSSAAIRISSNGARAHDVTKLLCETLNLNGPASKAISDANDNSLQDSSPRKESWDRVQDAWERDCLVLVGTLYYLPSQYVRFEHERLDALKNGANNASDEAEVRSSSSVSKPATFTTSDPPFHVIKTLSQTDNPIEQRNRMMEHLEKVLEESAAAFASTNGARRPTSVSPKLQWYFVPGSSHPSSPIPSYINLDGYSTSLEDDDEDDDDTDADETDESVENCRENCQQFSQGEDGSDDVLPDVPLQQEQNLEAETANQEHGESINSENVDISEKERIFKKERQRYFELSMCQSSLQHDCVSGYLLKQSMADPHVWKRVHCVLTDEHLWYISRVHTRIDHECGRNSEDSTASDPEHQQESQQPISRQLEFFSYAKHRRLGLTRALLLQPSSDKPKSPLFRTPFAFEVIDSNGAAHRFRASSLDNYKRWVSALSSRIVQSYENSLLEHAELIVRDETSARNKRLMAVAVEPLWEHQSRMLRQSIDDGNDSNTERRHKGDINRHSPLDSPTMQVLRFGMEVTEYRERCRHIQAILPAKYPVLAMTDTTPELKRNDSGSSHTEASSSSNGAFRLDSKTQALIKGAWDEAVRLGGYATKLAVSLQTPPSGSTASVASAKMPRCLETICQHLEYVITGNFRGALTSSGGQRQQQGGKPRSTTAFATRQGLPDNTRQYPPPIDIFDQLLAELQSVAAVASAKSRLATSQQAGRSPQPSVATGSRHIMNGGPHATKTK